MKKVIAVSLFLIILLASFLRLYKLDQIPPALNWDEVDAGYNAYTIANWGYDEWGQFLPLVFTSFYDDKHPIHIYLTAPIIKLFGLSDFTTRLPGAVFGVLSVLVIFYLARILFKDNLTALLSALFLAVSPYHLHFSRGLWEMGFALFFFMLGLLLFYLAIQKKGWLISLSFLSFGISILSYHSSKIIVPPILLLLIILYIKDLKRLSLNFYFGTFILVAFIIIIIVNPRILGLARIQQTQFSKEVIEKTQTFQNTNNHILGLGEITLNQYIKHFTVQYLFISGDQSPRNSSKIFGEFYKIDAVFIVLGLIYLLLLRSKVTLILLAWILLAPIPSSLVSGAPNATRALFMMGSINLIAALGAGQTISRIKGRVKIFVLIIILTILAIQSYIYLQYYFGDYAKNNAIDWQYGMKQIVEYVETHPEYKQIYITDIRSQPYIFFLYYLKIPLWQFVNTVTYNRSETKSFSLVSNFGKYYFGGWDIVESMPSGGILYVITDSQFDGLKHKSSFKVKKKIYYPNGSDAFYLVSAE